MFFFVGFPLSFRDNECRTNDSVQSTRVYRQQARNWALAQLSLSPENQFNYDAFTTTHAAYSEHWRATTSTYELVWVVRPLTCSHVGSSLDTCSFRTTTAANLRVSPVITAHLSTEYWVQVFRYDDPSTVILNVEFIIVISPPWLQLYAEFKLIRFRFVKFTWTCIAASINIDVKYKVVYKVFIKMF